MVSTPELLSAIIIEPDSQPRTTLHGLLKNDQLYRNLVYKNIQVASTFGEAKDFQTKGNTFDVVFISSKFPIEMVAEYIAFNRQTDPFHGICHIIVNNESSSNDSLLIAQGLSIGANSFLNFPCSVEKLRILTEVAQKIKIEATDRMIEASIKILIDNLLKEIRAKVEHYYDNDFFTKYSTQLRNAATFLLKDNQKTFHKYVDMLTVRTQAGTPKITLPKERLPRSKMLQEKRAKRMQQSAKS